MTALGENLVAIAATVLVGIIVFCVLVVIVLTIREYRCERENDVYDCEIEFVPAEPTQ